MPPMPPMPPMLPMPLMLHNPEMLCPVMMENLDIPKCLMNIDDAFYILQENIVSATLVRNSQIMENIVRGDDGRVPGARDINTLMDGNPQQGEQVQEVRHWIEVLIIRVVILDRVDIILHRKLY